jgi:methionine-rich copper-binding protein CopC
MARWGASAVSRRPVAASRAVVGPSRWVVAAAVVVAALTAGPAGPAGAHARVTGSSPADGDAVAQPPVEVSLVLGAKPATVEGDPLMVYGPDGRRVDTGTTRVSADRRTLTVAIDTALELPAGEYQVVYRVVSSDTHVIFGRLTFSAQFPNRVTASTPGGDAAQQLGSVWTPDSDRASLDQPPEARQLAAGRPDDVRPRAVAGGAAVVALLALAWRMRPGRRRRRLAAAAAAGAAARGATRRRRAAAAQPHDPRQGRRPPERRPAPAPTASRGAPRPVGAPGLGASVRPSGAPGTPGAPLAPGARGAPRGRAPGPLGPARTAAAVSLPPSAVRALPVDRRPGAFGELPPARAAGAPSVAGGGDARRRAMR